MVFLGFLMFCLFSLWFSGVLGSCFRVFYDFLFLSMVFDFFLKGWVDVLRGFLRVSDN